MPHKDGIRNSLKIGMPHNLIARKIFLTYPTKIFTGSEDLGFEICNVVSCFFKIPINHIQFSGSGKVGYSYFKNREFIPGKSDLDIAIVDLQLFNKYSEIVYGITKGFTDLTKFPTKDDTSVYHQYLRTLVRGFFRPDLMPYCPQKNEWFKFFNNLSSKYYKLFKNINAGIYASQYFFEQKQIDVVEKVLEAEGGSL